MIITIIQRLLHNLCDLLEAWLFGLIIACRFLTTTYSGIMLRANTIIANGLTTY